MKSPDMFNDENKSNQKSHKESINNLEIHLIKTRDQSRVQSLNLSI